MGFLLPSVKTPDCDMGLDLDWKGKEREGEEAVKSDSAMDRMFTRGGIVFKRAKGSKTAALECSIVATLFPQQCWYYIISETQQDQRKEINYYIF